MSDKTTKTSKTHKRRHTKDKKMGGGVQDHDPYSGIYLETAPGFWEAAPKNVKQQDLQSYLWIQRVDGDALWLGILVQYKKEIRRQYSSDPEEFWNWHLPTVSSRVSVPVASKSTDWLGVLIQEQNKWKVERGNHQLLYEQLEKANQLLQERLLESEEKAKAFATEIQSLRLRTKQQEQTFAKEITDLQDELKKTKAFACRQEKEIERLKITTVGGSSSASNLQKEIVGAIVAASSSTQYLEALDFLRNSSQSNEKKNEELKRQRLIVQNELRAQQEQNKNLINNGKSPATKKKKAKQDSSTTATSTGGNGNNDVDDKTNDVIQPSIVTVGEVETLTAPREVDIDGAEGWSDSGEAGYLRPADEVECDDLSTNDQIRLRAEIKQYCNS